MQSFCQWLLVVWVAVKVLYGLIESACDDDLGNRLAGVVGRIAFGSWFLAVLYGSGAFSMLF